METINIILNTLTPFFHSISVKRSFQEIWNVIESFALWGPNVLISDTIWNIVERAHMVDMLTLLLQSVAWSLNTIWTPDVSFTMEYNTF